MIHKFHHNNTPTYTHVCWHDSSNLKTFEIFLHMLSMVWSVLYCCKIFMGSGVDVEIILCKLNIHLRHIDLLLTCLKRSPLDEVLTLYNKERHSTSTYHIAQVPKTIHVTPHTRHPKASPNKPQANLPQPRTKSNDSKHFVSFARVVLLLLQKRSL